MPELATRKYYGASTSLSRTVRHMPSWAPNGSGKSTLSAVLVGNPLYEVTESEAWFNGDGKRSPN